MIEHPITFPGSPDQTHLLPLLPLKNMVLLPKGIHPILVGRPSSINAVEHALRYSKEVFITAQRHADTENPAQADIYPIGIRATILQAMRVQKGALKILVEGICRAELHLLHEQDGVVIAACRDIPTTNSAPDIELAALWRHVQTLFQSYARLNPRVPSDLLAQAKTTEEIDAISDTLALHINSAVEDRQRLLETVDLKDRLLMVGDFLKREIGILEVEEKIRGRVQTQVEKSQREFYLTEQMKAIQRELGRDDQHGEITQLRAKAKALNLPTEAAEKVEKELRRLEQMPPLSSEAVVSRNYVDWVLALPWNKMSKDTISIEQAEKILGRNHAGLSKVKERIIEFLAAKKFSTSLERSPILCLVGPPGVGKTSLAHSIADSLGREFVRISLGGIRDEAEIRGHRRTYIGALPGKIIQALKKAKSVNPVILLDEIDKMSSDLHGDPASALLEVLDPEQNRSFVDHFLELEYDLSKVMFIATANHIDGIPYPLYDRMEMIPLSGYTDQEKLSIARSFLLPKNLKEHGLKARQIKLSDDILTKIITQYTKEAGVRHLDRILAKLMRKSIQELLKNSARKTVAIDDTLLKTWLGVAKYRKQPPTDTNQRIGISYGLAWTELGGDLLEIEATVLPGKGGLTLTGQLGEVMQESAQAALSYIRERADQLGLRSNFYSTRELHVHIPEGATPKDGPSAGITLCVAMVSALTKQPTAPSVAMTGEITLRGRVLPVGGLKEKLLAAKQHAIAKVIVPKENKEDIEEFLHELGENLSIVYVSTMDEVVEHAFAAPLKKKGKKSSSTAKTRKKPTEAV